MRLKLDYDAPYWNAYSIARRWRFVRRAMRENGIKVSNLTSYKSSSGHGWHVEGDCSIGTSLALTTLQAALGSDPRREINNIGRSRLKIYRNGAWNRLWNAKWKKIRGEWTEYPRTRDDRLAKRLLNIIDETGP